LAVLLYQGLRPEEAAQLQVNHLVERRGIRYLMIHGKGGKARYLPVNPVAADRIHAYLENMYGYWRTTVKMLPEMSPQIFNLMPLTPLTVIIL
jgi:integrase